MTAMRYKSLVDIICQFYEKFLVVNNLIKIYVNLYLSFPMKQNKRNVYTAVVQYLLRVQGETFCQRERRTSSLRRFMKLVYELPSKHKTKLSKQYI